jgi:glycogen synthase
LNVALVPSAFHPSVGGVEELTRQLALEQHRRGWPTVVYVNRWPRDLPEQEDVGGIRVGRYAFRTVGDNLRQNLGAKLLGGTALRKLCRDLISDSIQLLHVQGVSCNAHYAILAARKLGLPLVVTLQGELTMDANQLFQRQESARELYRDALASADTITACSQQTLNQAEEFFGRKLAHKARVVFNGVRLEDFQSALPVSRPRPFIFAIGRHVPQKGFDILLRAFAQAGAATHDLLIAGDGPERAALESLAKKLKLGSAIEFLGNVDHPTAVNYYSGCSFFVLPSRHEPMGIVNLEAMAAGKAVIAAKVGGVPELVLDGQTGLLVPPENPTALADVMTKLTTDSDLRQRLGAAGRRRVEMFSWSALADQYEKIYEQAFSSAAANSPRVTCPATTQ